MLKIMHTGDIHLDSAFSRLDSRHSEIRRNELRAAFTSMMTYAKMNSADLMLISGDLFDSEFVTRETTALLCREFENFGRPILISPGNHDPATPKSLWLRNVLPDNVYVFTKPEVEAVALDDLGVTVYGYGFDSANLDHSPLAGCMVHDEPDRIHLLVCHCDTVTANSTDAPVTEEILSAFGADYAALGHIHNPPAPSPDGKWAYCGCLEGRGFDETGPKGACMVEIGKKNGVADITVKRVRLSKRRYERGTLTLDGASSQSEVREAVDAFIWEMHYGEDTLLSLTLNGFTAPELVIDTEALEDSPAPLFLLKITDNTVPDADPAALESDITIRGEVYRQLKPLLESGDDRQREVGRRALRYAFAALAGDKPL